MSHIELSNLKFAYNNGPALLNIESLNIEKGQKAIILGKSGSGKTTLLNLISGIIESANGSIKILDTDFSALSKSKKDLFRGKHISYIFQSFNLIPYLSVYENIFLPTIINQKKNKSETDKKIHEIAEELDISAILNKSATEISIGQQQRVAAARALIKSPDILIADEPTSALDHENREALLSYLFNQQEKSGFTILFVSHDETLINRFDQVIRMDSLKDGSHA